MTKSSLGAKLKSLAIQVLIISLITMAMLEALVAVSFRTPHWSPMPLWLIQYLHLRFDRIVIQVKPECARYDPTLSYTLKPGHCVFASREFSNDYWINSLGLRDDEESLKGPHTVILGDSLAMGWGVDQDDAFPSVFERLTGVRTLNAGVSSYGTVRELQLLNRIDRSAMKDVVIQYSGNDTLENRILIETPPFVNLSKAQYERFTANQERQSRYFPGRYAFNVLVQSQAVARRAAGLIDDAGAPETGRQAELFIRVLEQTSVDLSPFRVTVLSIDPGFAAAAEHRARSSAQPWLRNTLFLDGSAVVGAVGAQYTLDDHPTALGHEGLGRLLADSLGGRTASN